MIACFAFVKAVKAIHRTVFGRTERNFRFLAAFSAYRFEHFPGLAAVHTGFTGSTAGRAAFRLIGEAFFCVKFLLRSGKYKVITAFNAFQGLVFKHSTVTPFLCTP